jgi:hypothetical protein
MILHFITFILLHVWTSIYFTIKTGTDNNTATKMLSLLRNVAGYSLYVDEIIVVSPFTNPSCLAKEYNPINSPAQYKQATIRNVLLLLQLAPFIDAGIVHLIPDPCDFDYKLRKNILDIAKERAYNFKLSKKERDALERLHREDFMHSMWGLPEESLKRQIRKANPRISDDEMSTALRYIEEMRVRDPLTLLQPTQPGQDAGQLLMCQLSPNLELGLFLSQITGSFIYTDSFYRWKEILGTSEGGGTPINKGWEHVAKEISSIPFTFINQVDPQIVFALRQAGRFGNIRKTLRQLWKIVQSNLGPESEGIIAQSIAEDLKRELEKEWRIILKEIQTQYEYPIELSTISIKGKIDCRIPVAGFGLNAVYRLLISHSGRIDYLKYLPMAVFIEFDAS